MYRASPAPPRRPYAPYGAYRGGQRGAYGGPYGGQSYAPAYGAQPQGGYQVQPRPYLAPAGARHPYLDNLGIQSKFYFQQVDRLLLEVLQRHPRRLVSADLVSVQCLYADQEDLGIPLNVHVPFNLKGTETCPVPEPVTCKPHGKEGNQTRYFAKVLLFGGPAPEDEKLKGKVHLSKRLNFLLARKEHGSVAPIGGEWSADKDGAVPNEAALKKTAIRVTKDTIGIDLSKCSNWVKFMEFAYRQEDGVENRTTLFLPNIWEAFPEGLEPRTQAREETKEVKEEVEVEEEDPDDAEKKKKVKKEVTTSKVVKVVEIRPYEMSLHSMLEYDCTRSVANDVSEFCLFADCFNEMLQRDYGLQIIEMLKQKKEETILKEESEKKRKREEEEAAAAKKAKTEEASAEETKKEEEKKEEPKAEAPAKPKTKLQHTVNQEILCPFQFFDKQPHSGVISGSLRRENLEGILHQYGTMTKAEVDELLLKGAGLRPNTGVYNSPPSILYYVKMATTTTEVPIEDDKPEPAAAEAAAKTDGEKPTESQEVKDSQDTPMEESASQPTDGNPTEASLNKLLLKDLRTMCQEKGLSQTGKKADLIERILKGE